MSYQQGFPSHAIYAHDDGPYGPLPDEAEPNVSIAPLSSTEVNF